MAAAAASFVLAGCDDDTVPQPPMSTSSAAQAETATVTETTSAADSSGSDSATRPASMAATHGADGFSTAPTEQFGDAYGELRTTDIRVGTHESHDRLVFEFAGTGDPQYHIGYNDDPRQQASGFPLEVPGNAKLEINIHGTSGDMSVDAKYAGKKELGLASGNIVEVVNGGTFEADSQYVVGLKSERPYKVQVLHEPTRLVVDFQN